MMKKGLKITVLVVSLCLVIGLLAGFSALFRQDTGVIVSGRSAASDAGGDTETGGETGGDIVDEETKACYYLAQSEMGEYYFATEAQSGNYFAEIEHDNVIFYIDTLEYISVNCPICGESLMFGDGCLM